MVPSSIGTACLRPHLYLVPKLWLLDKCRNRSGAAQDYFQAHLEQSYLRPDLGLPAASFFEIVARVQKTGRRTFYIAKETICFSTL